jgi:hypothetical protein
MKKTIVPISGCFMILGCILAVSTFTKPVVFGTRNIKEIFPWQLLQYLLLLSEREEYDFKQRSRLGDVD